jgi:hypothetical protein
MEAHHNTHLSEAPQPTKKSKKRGISRLAKKAVPQFTNRK